MKAHERRCDAIPFAVNETNNGGADQKSVAEDARSVAPDTPASMKKNLHQLILAVFAFGLSSCVSLETGNISNGKDFSYLPDDTLSDTAKGRLVVLRCREHSIFESGTECFTPYIPSILDANPFEISINLDCSTARMGAARAYAREDQLIRGGS